MLAARTLALCFMTCAARAQTPSFLVPGAAAGDGAGTAVAIVGDVDGDGALDFALGSPRNDTAGNNAGMVQVYSGRTHLPIHTWFGSAANQRFGSAIAAVGDIDGDGRDDVVVGAPFANYADVYSGASGLVIHHWTAAGGGFGASVAGGGRVDGDAVPDILVGAPNAAPNGGALTVFSGATGLEIRSHVDACLSQFGRSAAFLGDVDGDGRDEYAIGRPVPIGGCGNPLVRAHDGASGALLWSSSTGSFSDQLGWSLASIADVDGDGVRDLLAGAPQDPGVGCGPCNGFGYVRLLSGASGATLWQVDGSSLYAGLGYTLTAVGDVNGNGFEDFAASQPATEGCGGNTQSVELRDGETGALLSSIPRPAIGDNFGFALASGDADDDGSRDLLVGTPCDDANGADSGAVRAYALPVAVAAERLYVDFGDPAGPWGVPPSTYGGVGDPGTWNGIGIPSGTVTGLLDAGGAVTFASLAVSATPMLDACVDPATSGADEALYDDRWAFDPPTITMTIAGLAEGTYRVHVHVLVGPCVGMFSPLSVTIAGATPGTADATAFGWGGSAVAGQNYTVQYASLAAAQDLVLQIAAPQGFSSYTQVCGLQIIRMDPPAAVCVGDGSGAPCPCGNSGAIGSGCQNSFLTGGARLRSTFGGLASVAHDSIELSTSGMPPSAPALYFQGTTAHAGGLGTAFGDGLVCAGGSVVRLGTEVSAGGASAYPGPGDPSVSVRGMIPPGGGSRVYQVWYRNAAAYCTPSVFNLSNGLVLVWGP